MPDGKTMFTEKMLIVSGEVRERGSVVFLTIGLLVDW